MAPVRVINVHGTRGYHKGWEKDSHKYPVLSHDLLTAHDREVAEAVVKTLTTGEEAEEYVYSTLNGRSPGFTRNWRYRLLDEQNSGRSGIISYKGAEIALFYKRHITEVTPQPGDPVPMNTVGDPNEAWQRFSLIGASAKRANRFIKQQVEEGTELVRLHRQQAKALETRNAFLENRVKSLTRQLESARKKVALRKGRLANNQRRLGQHDAMELMLKAYADARNAMDTAVMHRWVTEMWETVMVDMRKTAVKMKFRFIAPHRNETLNAKLHEVVGYDERMQDGIIAKVVEAGYIELPTTLVRPAKVIVGTLKEGEI